MLDQSIFKAYDIRGIVNQSLTDETVVWIGQALGSLAKDENQKDICVGYDGRLSSPNICKLLIEAAWGNSSEQENKPREKVPAINDVKTFLKDRFIYNLQPNLFIKHSQIIL